MWQALGRRDRPRDIAPWQLCSPYSATKSFPMASAGASPAQQPAVTWTTRENKIFETALAELYQHPDRWNKLAALLPGMTAADVKMRYQSLEEDILLIEAAGNPNVDTAASQPPPAKRVKVERQHSSELPDAAAIEKRKGVPWSEEEHRLFLLGLAQYGKGDWRSISRHYVLTRTPTQVASHAQKYFIRLNSMKKDRKRHSIHDITAPQQELQHIKQQVRQQQLQHAQLQKATQQTKAAVQQVKTAQRQAQKQAQADMEAKEELHQQLQQDDELLLQHFQVDDKISPFCDATLLEPFDWELPAMVSNGDDESSYDDSLLHTTQSASAAELSDWACSLLMPSSPEAQLQLSHSLPVSSSFLLPMC